METAFQGDPVRTVGELPAVGQPAPAFELAGSDLGALTSESLRGKRVVVNIFPSIDTGVCQASVRRFNQVAAEHPDTVVLCVSADLPFAQGRFCGAEGLQDVVTASTFRSDFGRDWGVELADSAMKGLLARAVVVLNQEGAVTYTQLVPEIGSEPDYDAVVHALG